MDNTFHKSLKPLVVEEFLDYYFYRRVAFRMIPFLRRLGVTPNQVTTLSMLVGLVGAYAVWRGFFPAAAIICLLAIFLDCCDGQLARLTGKASPFGRAMDGFCDLIWGTCLWLGIFFSGYFQERGHPYILALMLPASISAILHCWRYDAAKILLLELCGEDSGEGDLDIHQAWVLLKSNLRQFNPFAVILAAALIVQMFLFVRGMDHKQRLEWSITEKRALKTVFDPILRRWSWLGEGHHNTLLLVGLLLAPLSPYPLLAAFWLMIVPMNAWWLWCEAKTRLATRRVRMQATPAGI